MNATRCFTLKEAAQALSLPEVAVRRLSQVFQLPASYYDPDAAPPKLWLYRPDEIALLGAIQAALNTGKDLDSIKAQLPIIAAQSSVPIASNLASFSGALTATTEASPAEGTLMTYTRPAFLKEQWAQKTFQQYQLGNRLGKPPLQSLAQKLAAIKTTSPIAPEPPANPFHMPASSDELDSQWAIRQNLAAFRLSPQLRHQVTEAQRLLRIHI